MAEEYCWAISQAEGQSCCSKLHSSVLELDFNCIHTFTVDDMYTEFLLLPELKVLHK